MEKAFVGLSGKGGETTYTITIEGDKFIFVIEPEHFFDDTKVITRGGDVLLKWVADLKFIESKLDAFIREKKHGG